MTFLSTLALIGILSAAPPPDSVAEFRGIVQQGDSASSWKLVLLYPVRVGTTVVQSVRLSGDKLSRYEQRLVKAQGVAREEPGRSVTLDRAKLSEIRPDGAVTTMVSPMTTQHATITLAVAPNKFAWTSDAGDSTGVHPAVLFALANHGEVPLEFEFATNEVLCVAVRQRGASLAHWRYALTAGERFSRKVSVAMGNVLRWVVPIPPEAVPFGRGAYRVEVSLCGARVYGSEADFEITS